METHCGEDGLLGEAPQSHWPSPAELIEPVRIGLRMILYITPTSTSWLIALNDREDRRVVGGEAGLDLAFESEWSPPLGKPLLERLSNGTADSRLELGCVGAHGIFLCDPDGCHSTVVRDKAATVFLFELISRLQSVATVPMIDVRAYACWLVGPREEDEAT